MGDYLYHYTSVETLALILKNRTIRFSNLSVVDDVEEQRTKDFGDFGRYCFISCWTKDSGESIPLWHMYTPKMSGVRIKLREHPFGTEVLKANQWAKEDIIYSKGLLPLQVKHNVLVMPPYKAELYSVTYTEDSSLIDPSILSGTEHDFSIETKYIGKFKRETWSFQKEYRYRILVLPFTLLELDRLLRQSINKIKDKLLSHILPITHIDLSLNDDAFKDMEILCGPKVSEAQRIIIENLVEKYNPTASIRNSSLEIK